MPFNNIKIQSIFMLIIAAAFFCHAGVSASKVPFPDSSLLQPAPANIHPNISGNVRSTSGQNDSGGANASVQNSSIGQPGYSDLNKENNSNSPSKQGNSNFWRMFLPAAFFVILFFLLIKIIKAKD